MATNNNESSQLSYAEQYDIPRMTIGQIKEELEFSFTQRLYRGVYCIVGEAGLGKSQAVHQAARNLNARVCDIRTAQFGQLGAGVPSVKDVDENFFKIKLPTIFPKEGERSIVLFDEINQGLQHAIAMFFSVIEDRLIYDYKLPDDCLVVACMNPATASYAVNQIENNAALRRRLKFVYAIHSPEAWLVHARTREFHYSDRKSPAVQTAEVRELYKTNPEKADQLNQGMPCHDHIRAFIGTSPIMLYDERTQKANKPFACPASWQTISLECYAMEQAGIALTSSRAENRFGATLNLTTASQLRAFIEDNQVVLSPVEFLTDIRTFLEKFEAVKTAGKQPRLLEFIYNLLNYLFDNKYDTEKAYKSIFTFFKVEAAEYAALFTDNIAPTAKRYNQEEYRHRLLGSFVSDPKNPNGLTRQNIFREFLGQTEEAHDAVQKALRGEV